jgi:hypothetical protein
MTRKSFRKLSFILTAVVLSGVLYLSTTYATLAPLTPPPSGGYDSGSNSILDPGCGPTDTDCFVKEFQGWSLIGNSGTNAGTDFIGTTDAQDFVVKTNGNQIALFGQNGSTSFGSNINFSIPISSGENSFAVGGDNSAIGDLSVAMNVATLAEGNYSFASGNASQAQGDMSASFNDGSLAIGTGSFSTGFSTTSSGAYTSSFGSFTKSVSYSEFSLGVNNTEYIPINVSQFDSSDRLFSIGNGDGITHNAYSLWKDGSFAYNDDNFQNDNPGTEQNMFYFNYGNHDGAGSAQTKRAIRLGSAIDNEWDISTLNVGDRSIAIGFHSPTGLLEAPTATGDNSIAIGVGNDATGYASTALGFESNATGDYSLAFGGSAQGDNSVAFNKSAADGNYAFSAGRGALASSYNEISLGTYDTIYSPVSATAFNVIDRLFNVGNGTGLGSESDAFTILKNGKTSIGYDNFETTTLDSLLQVNGSILSADLAGCDSLSSDSDGKILCSGVTNGLGMISGSIGLGGTLTQNTTINQDIYNHTLLQPVSTTGALVMTQGLTTVTGLPGNVMGYIATNGDSARTISWASGASNKDLHTLSGSGDPDLLSGGSEIRTDYDITDTSSGMASLYAFDTPNGRTSRLQVTPTYLNIILDPAGELRINNSAGTSGYVLASNGTGAAPTWQDPNLLVSDERLKSNVSDLPSDTLSRLAQVRTVMYTLNTDQTNRIQVGFLAQDLEQYFPELVGQKDSTYKGVYYAQMTPVLVQAIRELNLNITDIANTAVSNTWRDALIAWFGNVENGISELFADRIRAKNEICIDDVCMTKDQLQVILNNNQIVPSPAPVPTIDDNTAPSGNDDQISPVDNPSDDGTDIGSSDPVVTPPADTPAPNDTPAPTE